MAKKKRVKRSAKSRAKRGAVRSRSIFLKAGANLRDAFSPSNGIDTLWGVLGGALYVLIPTAIQGWFKVNMTGWPTWLTGTGTSLFIGALFRNPGIMAGAGAASIAHFIYTKLNGSLIKPVFGTYAARFDPMASSTFADNDPALQPGATLKTLKNGDQVVLYDEKQSLNSVNDNFATSLENHEDSLMDNNGFRENLQDNYKSDLSDNYRSNLQDNYKSALSDSGTGRFKENPFGVLN